MRRLKLDRRGRLLFALGVVFFAVCVLAARWAAHEAGSAKHALAKLDAQRAGASSLAASERKYREALERFRAASLPLEKDAECGWVLADIERVAYAAGVRVVAVRPEARVEGFFRGHLRAVPYRVEVVGSGPAAEAFLALAEGIGVAELRSVSVTAADDPGAPPGTVRCSALLVLYSLNPPGREEVFPVPESRPDVWSPLCEEVVPGEAGGGAGR